MKYGWQFKHGVACHPAGTDGFLDKQRELEVVITYLFFPCLLRNVSSSFPGW